ncbi:MAG: alpha-ketoacid dehydrogenase subunit beta [Bdellovibrionales bacterium]|nr:alpha-ketoacid dehydrogenase subunit beta [Bdellovibrionales bacterium]
MRKLKGWEAIAEATVQAMEANPSLYVIGEGVDDPKGVFGTTLEPFKKFPNRVLDSPLSESAVTGIGIGAAIEGRPCIMVHARCEFLLLAMDQVLNHAAKWRYMSGGALSVPIVIRCVVGRGWGQAAQHSQTFHSLFAYVPGLKVALPSTPYDSKGLLMGAIADPNPVIFVEHRWLHNKEGEVPAEPYHLPLGKAAVAATGKDVTCVALSYQVLEALAARDILRGEGIEMEVIDLRTIRPLDKATILQSVRKTGRLLVTDIGHSQFGVCAEVSAVVAEEGFEFLKAPIRRVGLPDCPTPCSPVLEQAYYPNVGDLVNAARNLVKAKRTALNSSSNLKNEVSFTGPF